MTAKASLDPVRKIRKSLHDLAQPLSALTGMIDLLLMELDEANLLSQEVRKMNEQLEKVLQIVGEMRRLAREASPMEPLGREPLAHQNP